MMSGNLGPIELVFVLITCALALIPLVTLGLVVLIYDKVRRIEHIVNKDQ